MTSDGYAVLVGLNDYDDTQNLQSLNFAEKDCTDLQALLTDSSIGIFPAENTRLLIGREATTRAIEEALYTCVVKERTSEDMVLVYFSGHGFIAGDQQLPYLGSRDVLIKHLLRNPNLGLRMDRIHDDIFMASPARYVIFILDCCHSGALTPTSIRSLAGTTNKDLIDHRFFSTGNGRVALVACPPNAVSRESADLENGIFTHHLLRALRGAAVDLDTGEVTLDSLLSYVRHHAPPEQPPGSYGQCFGRIVLSRPGKKVTLKSHRLVLDSPSSVPIISRPLSNPLDPYVTFVDNLLSLLTGSHQNPGLDIETHVLNSIGRASNAEHVFILRFDGTFWVLKSQSEYTSELSNASESVEGALSRVLAAVPARIAARLFTLSESYPYELTPPTYKSFVVAPLITGPISEYMIVYGVEIDSYLLGDVYSQILATLYAATGSLTSVKPLIIESKIVDSMRKNFGYVPLSMYNRRFDLFRTRLSRMEIFFEPILYLDPRNLYICGWEALARDPDNELAPTDLFAAAELWGRQFITELDIYFMRFATRRYRQALAEAKMQRPYEVQDFSINVYPSSLMRSSYFNAVEEALKETGLLPQKLILEISEKAPIPEEVSDIEEFKHRLVRFATELRIGFAIDDFGVGYASVSRLVRLNPAYVKIDREVLLHEFGDHTIRFVLDVVTDDRLQSQKVVVEGFDSSSRMTLAQLYKLGIRYIQGYLVGRAGRKLYRLEVELQQYLQGLMTDIQ